MGPTVPPHVRLANDMAAQFHARPAGEASAAIAAHLRAFWDPRMRSALLAHVRSGGDGLDPLAVAAAGLLRSCAAR